MKRDKHTVTDEMQAILKQIDAALESCPDKEHPEPKKCAVCRKKLLNALNLAEQYKLTDRLLDIYNRLGSCYFILNDVDAALDCFTKAIKTGIKTTYYAKLLKANDCVARIYWIKNDLVKANDYYQKSLTYARKLKDETCIAGACLNISSILRIQGKLDLSIQYITEAIGGFTKLGDDKNLVMSKSNLSNIYFAQGSFEQALLLKLECIEYCRKAVWTQQLSLDCNTIAIFYNKMNHPDKAIEYALEALKLKEELDDKRSMAVSWLNLGVFFAEYGDAKSALDYYHKALDYYQATGDKSGQSMILNNIGNIRITQKKYTEALDCFLASLPLKQELGDKHGEATVLQNIGVIFLENLNRAQEGFDYLKQAAETAKTTEDPYQYAEILLHLCDAQNRMHQTEEALQTIAIAEQIITERKFDKLRPDYLRHLADVYKQKNDFRQAFALMEEYQELTELLCREETIAKIAEMQAKYETEKKEKEAEIYRLKNIELEAKNKQIEEQKVQLQDTLDKLQNSEIRYNFLSEELVRNIRTTLIGKSEVIRAISEMISMVAKSSHTNVLITGETGTGKEIVARNIHACSDRSKRHFYAVNCSAVPETLFESQFFGYEKNAFTGAAATKVGWFEIADKSTLFLDEIGNLSPDQQAKLLRALEERVIVRLGSHREIPFNVRVISATNLNLVDKVNADEFRRDLYHRLAVFVINIPPLRERMEEIPLLFKHFLGLASLSLNKKITKVEKNVLAHLTEYDYPGNVRELKNIVERAVLVSDSSTLRLEHFLVPITRSVNIASPEILPLREMERQLIIKTLRQTGFNRMQAAKILQVERKVIERKIKKYGITEQDID